MAKRNTENNDKRSEQLRIWVTPEEIEKIEKAQEENGCPNRSEFVRDAVKFYIGYLNNNKNIVSKRGNLLSYMGTREGVEKIKNIPSKDKPPTKEQFAKEVMADGKDVSL